MIEKNKIYCGDCLNLIKEIPDKSVDLILTDPPYNISKTDINKGSGILRQNFGEWDYDYKPELYIDEWQRVLKDNGQIYVFCSDVLIGDYSNLFNQHFGFFKLLVFWRSNPCPQFRKRTFVQNHQYICWGRQGNYTFNFISQNEMHTCFQYKFTIKDRVAHPNQKDVTLLEKLIKISTNENDLVLDCFVGSGSTAMACLKNNRNYIGIELNPEYIAIANKRIENYYKSTPIDLFI
jgi:DNA modification methylase